MVSNALQEDETRRQSETSTELSGPASIDATASPIEGGRAYWTAMARRLAPLFARSQSRQRALASLQGWRSAAARTNSWQRADVCGASTPDGCQAVLSRADGDAEAGRDARRREVIPPLGDPNGVLVVDATGVLDTGGDSAGVARQSRGTAGTVEHGQIGVVLG